jgi:hypothetical protein
LEDCGDIFFLIVWQAVMKIIKHCYEDRSNIDMPRGGLLGLVIENRLEITNTFAFPLTKAGEESVDEGI